MQTPGTIDGYIISELSVFTIRRELADGKESLVCQDASPLEAGREFVRVTTNVSALTGITQRVIVTDGLDHTFIVWEYGRGYSHDGKIFRDTPVRFKAAN